MLLSVALVPRGRLPFTDPVFVLFLNERTSSYYTSIIYPQNTPTLV